MTFGDLKIGDIFDIEMDFVDPDGTEYSDDIKYIKIQHIFSDISANSVCIDKYNVDLRGCLKYFDSNKNVSHVNWF